MEYTQHIYRDRKQISGCLGPNGEEREWGANAKGNRVPFVGDESVLNSGYANSAQP